MKLAKEIEGNCRMSEKPLEERQGSYKEVSLKMGEYLR